MQLRKFLAPELVVGDGALDLAGHYLRNLGARRVLLVTDPGVRAAGWVERVQKAVEATGIPVCVFEGVTPNPKDTEVHAGAEFFRSHECNALVAVGGGSPIDAAKGIALVVGNGGDVGDFEGVDEAPEPGPPLVGIPTTAGTAADISQFAIILATRRRVKFAIISRKVVPDVALIDSTTLSTAPPFLRACTGMDVLTHALEAIASNAASALTDLHAQEGVRLVHAWLERVVAVKDDREAMDGMMLASLEAGLAFSNASLGAVHAMAHALGGWLDLPHGLCNAILLPHVVAFNYDSAPAAYDRAAQALGLAVQGTTGKQRKAALVADLRRLSSQVGTAKPLRELGVAREDIPQLAQAAFVDPCLVTNPRRPSVADLEALYEEAL